MATMSLALVGWVMMVFLRMLLSDWPSVDRAYTEQERRQQALQLWSAFARLLSLLIALAFAAASSTHHVLWLVVAALVAPPLWWPVLALQLGAGRASALLALILRPFVWRVPERDACVFFLALGASDRPGGMAARRAEKLLSASEGVTRGAELAALGLLALARDQVEEARTWFGLVANISARLAPRYVRAHCHQFLLADAALRGNWYEVAERCQRGPLTPTGAAFAWAAACRDQRPSLRLRLGWVYALVFMPHRRWAWRLAEAARRSGAAAPPAAPSSFSEWLEALSSLHEAAPGSVPPQRLCELERWIAGLPGDAELLRGVRLRLAALGASCDPEEIVAQLQAEAREALLSHASQAWLDVDQLPLDELTRWEVQAQRADRVERLRDLLCDASSLLGDPRAVELWRLWGRLRAQLELAWSCAGARQSTFDGVGAPLVNVAAGLWNTKANRPLAHDIFHFLHEHRAWAPLEDQQLLEQNELASRRP